MRWDVFCKVIDNHGDLGVCWRLAADLAGRGDAVRLWVDDGAALAWMAPQGHPGVQVRPWGDAAQATDPGDVVVEAFGCEPDEGFVQSMAAQARAGRAPAWINLEYLSAEPWVERCHRLPSPVQAGAGRGLVKRFFYPGFTPATGGLLREPDLLERQAAFDPDRWLAAHGIRVQGETLASLFCYEPPGLGAWLEQLSQASRPTRLLVTAGRAQAAVREWLARHPAGALRIDWLPLLPQREFDHLLWSCDLNFVRGEDSLVRALWAGKPFVWNIYPQDDGAHLRKLDAFLDWFGAPDSLRRFHRAWNATAQDLPATELVAWGRAAQGARERLLGQQDLVSQLKSFAGTVEARAA
jgi:uncharacterized repeat protein (TIGR03837 family)